MCVLLRRTHSVSARTAAQTHTDGARYPQICVIAADVQIAYKSLDRFTKASVVLWTVESIC